MGALTDRTYTCRRCMPMVGPRDLSPDLCHRVGEIVRGVASEHSRSTGDGRDRQ